MPEQSVPNSIVAPRVFPEDGSSFNHWFPALLASARPKVEGRWFFKQDICLDGYDFVNCRFEQCVLTVKTGHFSFTACGVSECTFHFGDGAAQVVRTYNMTNRNQPDGLMPRQSADGTFTIG